jgi:hypothetical protein
MDWGLGHFNRHYIKLSWLLSSPIFADKQTSSLVVFFFIIQFLQQVGDGELNLGFLDKGDQAIPLSYKALCN